MVIAVDFDNTLSIGRYSYPDTGFPNRELIDKLLCLQNLGDKLILWTCREGDDLDRAVRWCEDYGIKFDAVNSNIESRVKKYKSDCRKIGCDLYIDDKAMSPNDFCRFDEIL